jgi:protease I
MGKPVAVICHGPWTLVEADVVRGRTISSWPILKTDLRNAGATWVDEQVHVDTNGPNTLVSSRKPDDLPAFNAQFVKTFSSDFARAS